MFIARAVLSETSSVRSGMARNPQRPPYLNMEMPLLTELGLRLGVCFYKQGTPTELISRGPDSPPQKEAHQCDIKATSRPVDSQLIATPKPP